MEITIDRLVTRLNELKVRYKRNENVVHDVNNMLTRLIAYQHPRIRARKDLDHKRQITMTDAIAMIKELSR